MCAVTAHAQRREQREFDFVLQRTPSAEHGAGLYGTCAACHGADGRGISDGSVPAVAGQSYAVIAKMLVDFRAGVRGDPRMQHFSDQNHLAYSQDIADVAAHISKLPPREWRSVDDPAGIRGARLYASQCERCHGAVAEGNEDELAPRLAGQHSGYLLSQLTASAGTRRPMEQAHARFNRLTADDTRAIVSYLSGDPVTQSKPGDSP